MTRVGGRSNGGTYRPLEAKGHLDVRDVGEGFGVGAKDVGERGAVRARWLRVDDVLRVFETHAEKYLTVVRRRATNAAGAGEGVDLQLEDSGGQRLGWGGQRTGYQQERTELVLLHARESPRTHIVYKQTVKLQKELCVKAHVCSGQQG